MKMKQRHFSILTTTESNILHHCRLGALPEAITLLKAQAQPMKPVVYASLLQTCTKARSFPLGTHLHAPVLKSGLLADRFVANSLLSLYFKLSPNFHHSCTLFQELPFKDAIAWTSIISGHIRNSHPRTALNHFLQMLRAAVAPNAFTLSSLLKACSCLQHLPLGKSLHAIVTSYGLHNNLVVNCALIDMYGRSGSINDARKVFDELLEPDFICWTATISTLARNDCFVDAVGLFSSMHDGGFGLEADEFTFGTLLNACGNLAWLRMGREVHGKVVTLGMKGNVVVESSLLDMYGKCGEVGCAEVVFDCLENKNEVALTAMLGVYCHNGECGSVLGLVREWGVVLVDVYSFATIIRACSGLAVVRQGKEVHCRYLRRGGWRDVVVESALVDLYAKCGCVNFAYRLFSRMEVRNLITWNAMIGGFAQNGRGREGVDLFEEMVKEGVRRPDGISFVNVLFACSHNGLVDQGRRYFDLMRRVYRIRPGVVHYTCMIDLLGRAELIEEAECLLESADCRYDHSLWTVLLGACTKCSDHVTAERVAKKMIQLEPDFHLSYVLLGNIYRAVGRWNDALEIRKLMEERGVKKTPGTSWIESKKKQKGSPRFDSSIVGKATIGGEAV